MALGSLATHGEYVGMANYEKLLTRDRSFNISIWNNLKWLIFYLASIPAGLFIALFLNQTVRGIRLYKSLFFFPFVISQIVVGLVFTWFYDPQFGLFNGIIGFIGFEPINVLGDPSLATYGVIAAGLWPQTAYCMILYLTGLNSVDPEQIEAARPRRCQRYANALARHLAAIASSNIYRVCGDHNRLTAVIRFNLNHDKWWPIRLITGAKFLYSLKNPYQNTVLKWATVLRLQSFYF